MVLHMDLLLHWVKMQPCLKATLPERPNSMCHQALLRAQLSHQRLQCNEKTEGAGAQNRTVKESGYLCASYI